MMNLIQRSRPYYFPILLFFSIIAGCITGYFMGPDAKVLKPLGDIFLNLLFTAVVPLVFFSIASSIAHIGEARKIFKVIASMLGVFIFTGIIAAIFMIAVVMIFPPGYDVILKFDMPNNLENINIIDQLVNIISVSSFSKLLTHMNMMPLIIFSFLTGLACAAVKEKSRDFSTFLKSGADVFMKVINYVMYYAPIGFFAYFAVLIGEKGTQLITSYFKVVVIYYLAALIYFVLAFSFYAFLAGGINNIKLFWKNVFIPMTTAFATCSSAASIPANLQATKDMKVSPDICETVIPMGAILHKDGSVLGAILKISFLFGIYGMSFNEPSTLFTAIFIALMAGTVMGAIPSGGMLGEMLILSMYAFPPQALVIIAAISIMIDPLATMLNVTGDSVCAMLVDRIMGKKTG